MIFIPSSSVGPLSVITVTASTGTFSQYFQVSSYTNMNECHFSSVTNADLCLFVRSSKMIVYTSSN